MIQVIAIARSARGRSRRALARSLSPLVLLALALAVGCDRNIEPFEPGEEPSAPDLARIFPAPPGGVGSVEAANRDTGQVARQAMPPSRSEGGPSTGGSDAPEPMAAEATAAIQGEIDLASELASDRPDGGILFVIARPQGARGGPPLAVLRIPDPVFPLAFRIGPENVMIPGMQFTGPISLSARLDADGNAMTRGAEDISSVVEEPLEPGATGIRLVLSQKG